MRHGDFIRKVIEERGITQQAFADMLVNSKTGAKGVSRQYAIQLLDMERLPDKRIEEINKLLDIDILKSSKEGDNVNEHQTSHLGYLHRIEMLKKDIEVLKVTVEARERELKLKDEMLDVYRERFKKHNVGNHL